MDTPAFSLSELMIARADTDGLPADHNLRILAGALQAASSAFLQCAARIGDFLAADEAARSEWLAYTGETA